MNWIQRFLTAITTHKDEVSAHHTAYTDDEADARVAFHADLETGVHGVGLSTVCSETELANAIGAHTTPAAHHAKYTNAEADARVAFHADLETGVHGVGLSTVCSETELANAIGAHTTPAAHHAKYTNAEADARINAALVCKASEILCNSNDAEKTTTSSIYTKIKEVKLNASLPSCRLKFDFKASASGAKVCARLYKNGVAIGTERSTSGTTYVTYSEDFSGFVTNNLIQIYARWGHSAPPEAYPVVKNLRLYYSRVGQPISTTNQDP